MKIIAINSHVLLIPMVREDATDSAQDNLVVFIETDTGLIGVGESDANPWILKATIEAPSTHTMGMGLKDMLMGTDPLRNSEEIWDELYTRTAMNGRRGMVIHAMGALDMALWDIKGKAAGLPIWKLPEFQDPDIPKCNHIPRIVPYASLQPAGSTLGEYRSCLVSWAIKAKSLGFKAAKLEATLTGPYAHEGMNNDSTEAVTSIVSAVREAVGIDFKLMVDVQYAFDDADKVSEMIMEWENLGLDVFFIETPLRMDQISEIAKLHKILIENNCTTKIAFGEWQATHYEFEELVNSAKIDILQPDVGRVGGLTEAKRVLKLANVQDKLIVPHVWKTGIGIAATAHLAAMAGNDLVPFIEFLPASLTNSPLRQRLTIDDEIVLQEDGNLAIPSRPGLGVKINMDALREFEDTAQKAIERGAGQGLGQAALAVPISNQAMDGFRTAATYQGGMNKNSIIPALIVGCGVIAKYHVKAMKTSGRFRCVAVVDPNIVAAEEMADEIMKDDTSMLDHLRRPKIFSSVDKALESIDIEFKVAFILVPNVGSLHAELAIKVAAQNYHVFLEKPIALHLEDAQNICKTNRLSDGGSKITVAENTAFWKPILVISKALKDNLIGEVHCIRAKCWESVGGPWAKCYTNDWICKDKEGPLFDSASHWIRPLRHWFGDICAVSAISSRPISRITGPTSMQALLRFSSGQTAIFESILAPNAISEQPFFVLQGTKGEIVLEGFHGEVYSYTGEPTDFKTYGDKTLLCKNHWDNSYADENLVLAEMLQSDNSDQCPKGLSPEEALEDLRVILALFKSRNGSWINV